MGAANCCKKPDEIVVEEVKYSATDNNKNNANEQDSYPKDTEQVYRSNVNAEDETAQNQAVSNQNLYEQDGGSPKIGGAYEVPINVSSPQQNYEEGYESNQMGSSQQYENVKLQNVEGTNINQYEQEEQARYQYVENQEMNAGEGNAYPGAQEEEGNEYNDLVNQVGNEANLKALRMANAGLNTASSSASYSIQQSRQVISNSYNKQFNNVENMGGVNLNTLSSAQQQGGLDLKSLNMGAQGQQTTTTTTTTTINRQQVESQRNESDDLSKYFQQASSKFASVNTQQMGNENIEMNYTKGNESVPSVDLKQLSYSANVQAQGGLDMNKLLQPDNLPTQTKVTKVTSVNQTSTNEDISKYFKQTNQSSLPARIKASSNLPISVGGPADAHKEEKTTVTEVKTSVEPNDNNLNQFKITKIQLDMDDLPETFGSSNIANFKQTTTTTTTKTTGNADQPGSDQNFQQTTTTTTTKTIGNIDMDDLPEVFGSFDINKFGQPTTLVKKEEIKVEKQNVDSGDNNNFKQTTTTTTTKTTGNADLADFKIDLKNYKLDMDDLPEVFGSSDISHFKQTTTTTTTTTKKEGVDLQKKDSKEQDNKNFKQITTTTAQGIIDMKDLPEVFGSSDINKFKQTTTTTTTITKKEGGEEKKESNQPDSNNFKQITTTTTTEGIIDMKDLPEVFGSSDINNFKQITTTTTTEGKLDMDDLPEVFGSFNISNFKQTTTETKTEGKLGPKDMQKGLDTTNLKNVKQTTTTTTKEGKIDLKDLPEGFDLSKVGGDVKQTTTTTKTIGALDMKDLPETFGSSDINNFKQTTTTTTTTGIIDMKDLPEVFGSSDITNYKQTKTTTTTTKTTGNAPIDLKQFNIEKNATEALSSPDTKEIQTTTVTKTTVENSPVDLKQIGMEQNATINEAGGEDFSKYFQGEIQTTSEPIDLKQFGLEQNPSSMSNIQQITKTTKTTKTETSNTGNIDLKQFGMEQNASTNVTGTEDFSKYFQGEVQTTSEPIDLKQFGLEQNPSSMTNFQQITKTTKIEGNAPVDIKQFGIEQNSSISPVGENEDYSKYFQTTQTTTTKTTGPVDLSQFGINASSAGGLDLNSLGFDGGQQKTTTTTTVTKTENVGGNTDLGNIDLKSYGITNDSENNVISYGVTQNAESNYNTYETNKVTTTKVTKSYVGPTQSYSYNYSYNMPATGSTTVTKTTYSGVVPDQK